MDTPVDTSSHTCVDLQGTWRFRLDPDDRGIDETWFSETFSDRIELPGSLQEQGYGNRPSLETPWIGLQVGDWDTPRFAPYRTAENFKMPFWLTPDRHYTGAAWYQRDLDIPSHWSGSWLCLFFERVHWEAQVWLDDRLLGVSRHLGAPQAFEFKESPCPGRHRLTLRVDNRRVVNVGPNAHSVSDHTQSAWNGIVGALQLHRKPAAAVRIDDVQVYPDVANQAAGLKVSLQGIPHDEALLAGWTLHVQAQCEDGPEQSLAPVVLRDRSDLTLTLPLGDEPSLWDEFSPNLYSLTVTLKKDGVPVDLQTTSFGMREVSTRGTQILLNGRPIFLRGTLECCVFPKTGYPPTDVEPWRRILRICRAQGMNHLRFHSWCPPEAAFVAADEIGFYYQVECGAWVNNDVSLGSGEAVDAWLYEEGEAMIRTYGNHPSFLLMAYGNEPGGEHQEAYLSKWCTHWRRRDPRHLHTGGAGWPVTPESDFNNLPDPRLHQWGEAMESILNAQPPSTEYDWSDKLRPYSDKPTVSHEIGQWCAYPNRDEIPKYTGVLKAKNYEIFHDLLRERGMGDQAHDFFMASGRLQALCYKAEIEAALRTPGFAGFQLLSLNDFPGQGTATVGVLDAFWDRKDYIEPDTFRRFCNATVPLVRLPAMVFSAGQSVTAPVQVAHYGPWDLESVDVPWSLRDDQGKTRASGRFEDVTIPAGGLRDVGNLTINFKGFDVATHCILTLSIADADIENQWDLYIYPQEESMAPPSGIRVVREIDDATLDILNHGGTVWLQLDPSRVASDVQAGFSSIFWNTSWTKGQPPHTLGILCDPDHPCLKGFPTPFHSDWPWWYVIASAATMELDRIDWKGKPLIQMVPDWFDPKKLALAFEARVGEGKLLVTSIDFTSPVLPNPVTTRLYNSLMQYINSPDFDPLESLAIDRINRLTGSPDGPQAEAIENA